MAYQITITDVATRHLRALSARERRVVEAAIVTKLADRPTTVTKAVRRLRPNPCAEYELRVGSIRVLYNVAVDRPEVILLLIGVKSGNKLIVEGEEFHGHRSDSRQSPAE
jgi:mRNA-degrading endonuclease RelE of RelBE toxin-antitoxin system